MFLTNEVPSPQDSLRHCPRIALIDSGIGGLSVLVEIEAQIPGLAISYFMDNLYLPYGELSEAKLVERLTCIVDFLLSQSPLDIIVIACNTASTQSLDFLRQRFEHTFVGVVPAIKPAAMASATGHIGLLATPATVGGDYINQLIDNFAINCSVQKVGSSELVHLAEDLFWHGEDNLDCSDADVYADIVRITSDFKQVDTVVLGCTHFPLIKSAIQQALGNGVLLVDSGKAIANRVSSLLGVTGTQSVQLGVGKKQLFTTRLLSLPKQHKLTAMGFDCIVDVAVQSPAITV
ncbi:MAG: glutamate racemase [Alteromonadaceae bacterium]|jgi:glutamate racemase